MASFAVRPSRPWSVEESAMFAARKEFELLKLLSTDANEGPGDGSSTRLLLWPDAAANANAASYGHCG